MHEQSDIAYEILRALRRILRRVSQHSRSLSQRSGLTVPQLLCLRAVARGAEAPGVTVAEVAARVRLSPATTSRILDRLERAGFVLRQRNAADRRKVCVTLTTLGEERLKNVPRPLHEQFLKRVEALAPEERAALLASLDRIVVMMEAAGIDASPVLTPELDVKKPAAGLE